MTLFILKVVIHKKKIKSFDVFFLLQLPDSEKTKTVELFTTRRNQYRIAALTCKKAGDIQHAKQFLAVSKVKERKEALSSVIIINWLTVTYKPFPLFRFSYDNNSS